MPKVAGLFRGDRLREVRLKRELSQEALADRLTTLRGDFESAGLERGAFTQQHISKWESGDNEPSVGMLALLVSVLRVNADYLLGVTDELRLMNTTNNPSPLYSLQLREARRKRLIRKRSERLTPDTELDDE